MKTVVTDAAAVLGLALLVGSFLRAAYKLQRRVNPGRHLARAYASPYGRIVDGFYWTARHLRQATRTPNRAASLQAAWGSFWIGALTAAVPIAAVVAAETPSLDKHGLALGVGAVVWSCVVEVAGMSERIERLARATVISVPVAFSISAVAVLNVIVVIIAAVPLVSGEAGKTAAIGAAFIAMADLMSALWGLILAGQHDHPLMDP